MNKRLPDLPLRCAGGCHCGAIRFEVWIRSLDVLECNCSICTKKGFLHLIVPKKDFELLRGETSLSTYTFGTHKAQHHFCNQCGVHSFYIARSHPNGIDVNLRCLDMDLVAQATRIPFDGRDWEQHIDEISGYR